MLIRESDCSVIQSDVSGIIVSAEGQPNTHGHINSDGNHKAPDFYSFKGCESCIDLPVGTHVIYNRADTPFGPQAVNIHSLP